MPNSLPVLITDGLWRKSLSATRSLGKAGFHVGIHGDTILAPSFWSRYARQRFLGPSARDNPELCWESMVRSLKRLAARTGARPALLPMEDATLRLCLEREQTLSELAYVLLPPRSSFEIASDKELTRRHAERVGILTPETLVPTDATDLKNKILSRTLGKWLIKPRSGRGSSGIRHDLDISFDELRKHWDQHGPLLLQRRLPREGAGLGASLLFDRKGRFTAGFAHRRLHEYPLSGGPSSDREGILDEPLIQESRKLLESLNWKGVAMVEWKEDPRTGKRYLLEINPRFWGSLELAVRSGANFPLWYTLLARGDRIESPTRPRVGVRSRTLFPGDILRYLGTPHERREPLREFLRGLPQSADEWDSNDLRSSLLTPLLLAILALRPKYWRYLGQR